MPVLDEAAIIVKDVSKTFKIPLDKASGIKQAVIRSTKRTKGFRNFKVLEDISFEVKKGEFFGIVGRNGSGKSTLLKLLAGIYVPDRGAIHVNGSLTPFIELGVGFNPELTARENVFLNGALLGFNRHEVELMYDEIVSFAELESFMAEKLKNFSSGMQVRLAFSIAIRSHSEILIMDEVLAVGDADFQKKCFAVFRELKKEGRTIILVTHDMGNVERFCDRVLIIDKGEAASITTPAKAAALYARLNIDDSKQSAINKGQGVVRWGTGGIRIKNLKISPSDNKEIPILDFQDPFELTIELEKEHRHKHTPFTVGLAFINQDNITVAGPNTLSSVIDPSSESIKYRIDKLPLQPGDYSLTVAIYEKESEEAFDFYDRAISFHVISDKAPQGLVTLGGTWSSE
jgi:ABC-2 type transport system ATP-binding protein